MSTRRLAVASIAASLVVYVACKDDNDDTDTSPTSADAGTSSGGSSGSSGGGDGGGAGDGGDASTVATCTGNPLADVPDGGVVVTTGVKAIATGPFLDGPQWSDDQNGAIFYSEVTAQTVVRNGPDGGVRVPFRETQPNELVIGNAIAGGYLFTAMSSTAGTGAILRTKLDGTDPRTFAAAPAISPNDIVGSTKGFVYFTDPGFQALTANPVTGVYRMGLDGGVEPVQQFNAGANPGARADGIALSADETTLYVGFFDERRIAKYTVDPTGTVAPNPAAFPAAPAEVPTGMAVDVGGNLWVAENDPIETNARGRVEVFSPTGQKWGEIPFNDARPTGIAFGGADRKTVYITTERENTGGDGGTGAAPLGTLYVFVSRCAGVP